MFDRSPLPIHDAPPAHASTDRLAAVAGWNPSTRDFARWILSFMLATALAYLPTLTISPPVWMDEVHIVEYGRLFFEPSTSWSIHWHGDHPVMPWYVVGAAAEELLARLSAPSCLGTRVLGTAGALLSATMLALWLKQRAVQPIAAAMLAFVYAFEPPFVAAYRGGRLDGWSQCCAFSACYLLSTYRARADSWRLWAAGGLTAWGFFVWPSISFLLPLMLLELVPVLRSGRRLQYANGLRFGLAAALVTALVSVVVIWQVPRVLGDIGRQLAIAGMTPAAARESFDAKLLLLLKLLFGYTPLHLLLIAYALRHARSYLPLLLMLVPLGLILSSLLYTNRVMYLVPYLLVFCSEAFPPRTGARPWLVRGQPLGLWLIAATLLSSASISVGLRSVNAWLQRGERDESNVYRAAAEVPALTGPICIQPMEFYFIGRSLGWRMFGSEPEDMQHCEAVILGALTKPVVARLEDAGFRLEKTLQGSSSHTEPAYGARGFGPYWFYRRASPTAPAPQ